MIDEEKIKKILMKMGMYSKTNYEIIEKETVVMGITLKDFLFEISKNKYDEELCYLAISSLFKVGEMDPNSVDGDGLNFLQNIFLGGYSSKFIIDIIKVVQ